MPDNIIKQLNDRARQESNEAVDQLEFTQTDNDDADNPDPGVNELHDPITVPIDAPLVIEANHTPPVDQDDVIIEQRAYTDDVPIIEGEDDQSCAPEAESEIDDSLHHADAQPVHADPQPELAIPRALVHPP
jgi:hypothetical protein